MREHFTSAIPKLWETVRYSYWLIPSARALGSLGLAFGLFCLDRLEEDGFVSELGSVNVPASSSIHAVISRVA
jgi:hypothetical protein